MANEPPELTVVAQNDDTELRKRQALDALEWPTREMAANLLRIMRGHGRPFELPQQIINVSELILQANELSNAWGIWSVMEEVLQSAFRPQEAFDYEERPELTVARGSLQMLASHLIFQNAQEAAGRREISDGVKEFEQRRERIGKQMQLEERQWRQTLKARTKKPRKKAAKPKTVSAPPLQEAPAQTAPASDEPTSTVEFMRRRQREMRGNE